MWIRPIQMIKLSMLTAILAGAATLNAQETATDSLKEVNLEGVTVEAAAQNLSARVSTYYPTATQKNASQTGIELLNRMAIPQLALGSGTSVTTVAGQGVDLFIDWLPASNADMINMRMTDVKKVEYYDYPSDPRFLGKAHVVNFIMKKYEYGGYMKTSASERFIANDGQLNLFTKFQIKKFTFDLGLGGSYSNSAHNYTESSETYRFPGQDGGENVFYRSVSVNTADRLSKLFWPTLKAVYSTEKVTISNTIGASFDHTPTDRYSGIVNYTPDVFETEDFVNDRTMRENSISYTGNWNFILGEKTTLNFNPNYAYSHSRQSTLYKEGSQEFPNIASDDSHQGRALLQLSQKIGKGSLNISCQGIFYTSSTSYTGTANLSDRLTTYRIGPGVSYGVSVKKCYIYVGAGFHHDRSKYGSIVEHSTQPWADASFQYSPGRKSRFSFDFHHMTSIPSSSYRSEAIIQANPLLSYTGNPALRPSKSFDYGVNYTFIPDNRFSFSAYVGACTVTDRYAFVYTPTPTGILRTIEQPLGSYTSMNAGLYGRANLLHNKLQLSAQLGVPFCHNGYPYNNDKAHVNYSLRAFWYFGAWNAGVQYISDWASVGYDANGVWTTRKNIYTASIGWGNQIWNVSATIANPFSWSWVSAKTRMLSTYYDRRQTLYGAGSHCYAKLSVTYVFGFGKKVKQTRDVTRQTGAGSAILQ